MVLDKGPEEVARIVMRTYPEVILISHLLEGISMYI